MEFYNLLRLIDIQAEFEWGARTIDNIITIIGATLGFYIGYIERFKIICSKISDKMK